MRCGRSWASGWSRGGSHECPRPAPPAARRHARGPDFRWRLAAGALHQLRQAAAHPLRAALRPPRGAGSLARQSGHLAHSAARCARLLGRALGSDGVQPDRGPGIRRAEPAHQYPGAAARRAHADPGLGFGPRRRQPVSLRGQPAQSGVSPARAGRAALGDGLQLRQAIHLLAPSLAGAGARHRAGGRLPGRDRTLERAMVGAHCRYLRSGDMGRGLRHFLCPAG